MATPQAYWIKQRTNPQLGVYYVACGQLSLRKAKQSERVLYGSNVMLPFDTEAAYLAELQSLRDHGCKVI